MQPRVGSGRLVGVWDVMCVGVPCPTCEDEPLHQPIQSHQLQLLAELLVQRPVGTLAHHAAVVHILAPVERGSVPSHGGATSWPAEPGSLPPPRAASLFRGCPAAGGGGGGQAPPASLWLELRGQIQSHDMRPSSPIPLASPEAFGVRESVGELFAFSTELEGVFHLLEHVKVGPDAKITAALPPIHGRPGGVRG